MSEDAGTVYAELRLALDKLQGDVTKAGDLFRKIGNEVDKTTSKTEKGFTGVSKTISKSLTDMSNNTVNQFAKMASGMQKAIKAVPKLQFLEATLVASFSL